jgi:hypothetical protein
VTEQWDEHVGWCRHCTFGMRTEWLDLWLDWPDTWSAVGDLGPRQVQSFRRWLVTGGLVHKSGDVGDLASLFKETRSAYRLGWQIVWTNVVFRFATARWYVSEMGKGSWDTRALRTALGRAVPRLASRTAGNAILELVGTLERTPIGEDLGQGIVHPGRPRRVVRVGLASPAPQALAHAFRLLFLSEQRDVLRFDEGILWPWTVFGCDRAEALALLRAQGLNWLKFSDESAECSIPLEVLQDVALF